MLGEKEKQILKLLVKHKHTYLTSQEVASELSVSNRTARKYILLLEDVLKKERVGEVISKPGQGYYLNIMDSKKFNQFFVEETREEFLLNNQNIKGINDRHHFILNRLFFGGEGVYVDDLAEQLFVSRSTISNDLVEIKRLIDPYQIQLKSKSNKGIYVSGREQDIRHFIMNYFFMGRLHENFFAFSMYSDLLADISVEEIMIIVLDECREAKLKLSDYVVYNVVMHISLAINRIKNGFLIDVSAPVYVDTDSAEYQTALRMMNRIKEIIGFPFPDNEADFIALHLMSIDTSPKIFQETHFSQSEIKSQLLEVLTQIEQVTGYLLTQDQILIDGLMAHFVPLLLRLQNNSSIDNPLLKEIKDKYAELFETTVFYFAKMPIFQPYQVTEGEWAYIAIHLIAASERYYNEQKVHVLVICATGIGSSQMIKSRIEHEFGSKIDIKKVIGYYEIAEQDLSQVDLVISSINLQNVILNIPIVQVSVFLGEKDIEKINDEITRLKRIENIQLGIGEKQSLPTVQYQKWIQQFFSPTLFYFSSKKMKKKEVLRQLIQQIETVEQKAIFKELSQQLKLRESYSSVVFSPFLAVPHPIEAVTDRGYVAVAVVPEGVFWSTEYEHVQLIFLLSPDKFGQFEIEKVSQMLVEVMEDDQFRQDLVHSQNYEEWLSVFFKKFEEK